MKILAQMLAMLTSAYRKSDEYNIANNISLESVQGRFFSVLGWGLGLIEENSQRVRLWADIDNAQGAVLDRYGENFGVARGGANNVFYRLMIKIKILAQISGGDIETILTVVSGLYEIDPINIEIYEVFPAKLQIAIYEKDLPSKYDGVKDLVGVLTKRILAAGVGLDMIYMLEDIFESKIYISGKPVSEFSRVRLMSYSESIDKLSAQLYISGHVVSQASRIRLNNQN